MRTPILATLLGLSLIACAGEITGGGGDDDVPETCGNGTVDVGEQCDGTADCEADCTFAPVPRLDVTVDKPTINTELGTTNVVMVSMQGAGGYGGQVGLSATIVDANNMPLTNWVVAVNPPSVTVTTDGQASAVVTFSIPSENRGLAGTLKVVATTTAQTGTHEASSAITALNQITIPMKLDANGQCDYPADGTIRVVTGTKVIWKNDELAGSGNNITIHINEIAGSGFNHQNDPGSAPQTTYEQTAANTGNAFSWYCHAPGPTVNGLLLQVVP